MKLSKLIVVLVVILLAVTTLATTVSAASVDVKATEELTSYLTSSHKVGAMTFEMSAFQKDDVNFYFKNNPVTAEQANQIKAEVAAAINTVPAGTSNLKSLTGAQKSQALSHINAAAAVIGAKVTINTSNNTYTVTDKNGATISSSGFTMDGSAIVVGGGSSSASSSNGTVAKFVQTGSDVSVFAVIATIAMVAVSAYFVKKVHA